MTEWSGRTLRQQIQTLRGREWRLLPDGKVDAPGIEPFRVVAFPVTERVRQEIIWLIRDILKEDA